ncbi:MAG TPA: class II aldolase/adducin family protein [Beijerinckiaceae bacterium]|nr:class II aldolase/adducin family protein [Beijerinckiaceae bacterium]
MRFLQCACQSGWSLWSSVRRAPADRGGEPAAAPSGGPVDRSALEDLAIASRILADQGVFDAFGHISMRHPGAADRFLMSRSLAPALVRADDIMEFDLDSRACEARGRAAFFERFIHGQIYKARPDVAAIVHSHSLSVIPFGLVKTPMRAMYHNAAFVAEGVPVFDIRQKFGATDMLVGDNAKGAELARTLGTKCVCLMRAHGSVAVGPTLQIAVFRAVMTENNARVQSQAVLLGGPIEALDAEEGRLADAVNLNVVGRPWELWKKRVAAGPSTPPIN